MTALKRDLCLCACEEQSTLRSLLLVRKSVEGFKMAVMARASSSCAVLPFTAEQVSVLNTY